MFLTSTHQPASARVTLGAGIVSSSALIECGDIAALSSAGLYRHITAAGAAPLGYTEWVESVDEHGALYTREPAGTEEERLAVLLATEKESAQERRAAQRLSAQTGGFTFAGATFASDREESIPLLTNAALSAQMALAQGPEAAAAFGAALGDGWRDTTGTGRITTAEGILALHAAFVSHGAACDRHSQSLKAAIDAAQSVEELDAIDLTAGWPA